MRSLLLMGLVFLLAACASSGVEKPCCDLTGSYQYFGQGEATVQQEEANVTMQLTWSPSGQGPHYEITATLVGTTLQGEWNPLFQGGGPYPFLAEVSEDGSQIDFSGSEDPIDSNMSKVVLERK